MTTTARERAVSAGFPFMAWPEFLRSMDWKQGEHVTMVAPTGQGKTTLASELVNYWRDYVMVLVTKREDKTLQRFAGYANTLHPREDQHRVLIQPPFPRDPDELLAIHRAVFKRTLAQVYRQGRWCVVADEIRYLANNLKLAEQLGILWLQGRSLKVSLVALTQRPRNIPLEAYDQATHLFFWRDSDMGNVERIAEIGGTVDRRAIMARVPQLPEHQFLYVDTRRDRILESKVEV